MEYGSKKMLDKAARAAKEASAEYELYLQKCLADNPFHITYTQEELDDFNSKHRLSLND